MKVILSLLSSIALAGCSVFGSNNVENAPYTVVNTAEEKKIEIRTYDSMILVSTPMTAKSESNDGRNSAFRKLFDYISGENTGTQKIEMTAPVFMDENADKEEGTKIPMTAPVFMDEGTSEPMMSFVMPASFTLSNTPEPTNPDVTVSEVKDYTVAVIQFSGTLSDRNVDKHKKILEDWINENGYKATGGYKKAGYDAPFTLPPFRRNEVLIPIQK